MKDQGLNYENQLVEVLLNEENEEVAHLKAKNAALESVHQKLTDAIREVAGEGGVHFGDLPSNEQGKILDLAFGHKGSLIQPSHKLLPFSLIRNRDVERFIPSVPDESSPLDFLLKDSAVRSMEVIHEYTSENTKRAFNGDIVYWQAWLSAIGCDFTKPPITKEVLKLFIIQHVEKMNPEIDRILVEQGYKSQLGEHSFNTVERRVHSLSVCLQLDGLENPCWDKEVKMLLSKFKKKYGKSKRKKAITKDILDDMLLTCGTCLIDVRDRAILFFAWASGGRRRSEVINADMSNLIETADGDFIYNLNKSKTNQTGEDDYKPIKGRAAKALRDWLEVSGVKEGPIFRSVGKGGDIRGGLSGNDMRRIVKKRALAAGYDEKQFSAHSLRGGFITEGGRQGKPIGDIMKMTSHRSITTAMRYYEAGNITNNSCAELAG